ncbi:Uma2 family endonuclease [Micromonospora endolithica]|uniref:Uma2 family endonuclease n=1 Tax=Micromonospora endolithica TaxID=230091 RepID=A0A3A9Z7G9_9ACTN|nr:Uma2 family endonuclease [Micromonospora endolithica]RKN44285.1 Uma2 family endonuclease [Micromonospora endolithica]TWJ25760.1 Uma2 family endonuclease [Micromonospora endolithica]
MTAALHGDYPPEGGWTTDDLDALPEDGRRRELLDGVLLMSPSPTRTHQIIAGRLMVALEADCPDEYDVTQGVEVRINRTRSFVPDVLVTTSVAAVREPSRYEPHEVVLAVEIVSPSSRSIDRVLKPALYAQAGIPFYWRIETEDGALQVVTYRIDAVNEVYVETGRWAKFLDTGEPFPINLPISRITPRAR